MKYMDIGKTGIKASVISLGTWAIGGGSWWKNTEDSEAIWTIERALDLGVNLIDTAPVYGFGHSEEVIGKAIKGRRDKVILSTKCGLWWDDSEGSPHFTKDNHNVKVNVSRRAIKADVEKSLRRLGTDYIDIYYTHQQAKEPFMTPVEETVDTLMELKKEGKIRAIGASNVKGYHIRDYISLGQLDIVQQKYSLLDRAVEEEILPLCKENNIALHAYSPLEQGILTGKVPRDFTFDKEDARNNKTWWKKENLPKALDLADDLKLLAEKYNCTVAHIAIAWIRAQGWNINVICGARKAQQIEENAAASEISLSYEDILLMRERAAEII